MPMPAILTDMSALTRKNEKREFSANQTGKHVSICRCIPFSIPIAKIIAV